MSGYRGIARGTRRRLAALLGVSLIVSGLVPTFVAPVLGADTTFQAPASAVAPNGWTDGANALGATDDAAVATASGDNVDQGFADFGFAIPAGSIIDGITIRANAWSTDADGCRISARVSRDGGATFSGRNDAQLNDDPDAVVVIGSATELWGTGDVWDPTQLSNASFRLELRNEDDGAACDGTTSLDWVTVRVTYRTIDHGTANPALGGDVCQAADFNFALDMSGSIGPDNGAPSNLPDLKAGIGDFVTAFQDAGGDGRYAGTRFNDDSAANLTAGYTDAATFTAEVNALSGPGGLTPTALGIGTAAANNANDRAGIPNVLLVVTDGSPNKPNTTADDLSDPATWLEGANAAIAAADDARAGSGADRYVVKAVYLSAPGDPGDTSLPFSDAGDAQWAETVMDEIGGGTHLDADFSAIASELFKALECPPPALHLAKAADAASVNAGDPVGFTLTLSNDGGSAAHAVVVDDPLPALDGVDWSLDPAVEGCSISGDAGSQALHCDLGTVAQGTDVSIHLVAQTGAACGTLDNEASYDSSDGGSGTADASIDVECAGIAIDKVADDPTVTAGEAIGFTITVGSTGAGAASGVAMSDPLPTDAGTAWAIDGGTGAAMCSIAAGLLGCDFGTMQPGASYTVHLSSPTTAGTVADSPVDNTASVTTTNDGSDEASDW